VRILVDTQCWLWMAGALEKLSARARRLVGRADHTLYLSVASAWEVAIKHALGKLQLPEPPLTYVPTRLEALRTQSLSIDLDHVLRVATLPMHHRDPFDRLLVAQAQAEHLPILTADPVFARYGVETIDAA
jgi:PIN domain nuclease of toxin-antitoxin system